MSTLDWSVGRYEVTAAQLEPAARVLVDRAAPAAGERVVDVGCGTGSAALLAAERGARVTGVDPAPRLLGVASKQAAERGLDATFARGDAAAIPLADGEADVVLSAFGVIFAPDPRAAAAEMARVTAPDGRIVLSAWNPSGAVHRAVRAAGEAVRSALGAPPGPPPFPWHEREALAELFAPHGFDVAIEEQRLAFTAPSPGPTSRRRPTTRSRWPAKPSSPRAARARRCGLGCSRSTTRPTRTRMRSGSHPPTWWPRRAGDRWRSRTNASRRAARSAGAGGRQAEDRLLDRHAADVCVERAHEKISVVQSPPCSRTSWARAGPAALLEVDVEFADRAPSPGRVAVDLQQPRAQVRVELVVPGAVERVRHVQPPPVHRELQHLRPAGQLASPCRTGPARRRTRPAPSASGCAGSEMSYWRMSPCSQLLK